MEPTLLAALVTAGGGIVAKLAELAIKRVRLHNRTRPDALPATRKNTPDLVEMAWDERAEARVREDHWHDKYFDVCNELERVREERDQALRMGEALLHKAGEAESLHVSMEQMQHALAGAHETIASLNALSVEQASTISELRATLARIGDYSV